MVLVAYEGTGARAEIRIRLVPCRFEAFCEDTRESFAKGYKGRIGIMRGEGFDEVVGEIGECGGEGFVKGQRGPISIGRDGGNGAMSEGGRSRLRTMVERLVGRSSRRREKDEGGSVHGCLCRVGGCLLSMHGGPAPKAMRSGGFEKSG